MFERHKSAFSTWILLLGVFFWGASFVYVKDAIDSVDVFSFLFMRFTLSAVIVGFISIGRLKKISIELLWKSVAMGLMLAVSFVFQTFGIKYTTASNAAFITGLCVVLVPVFISVVDRRLPSPLKIASVVLGFVGLGLLTLKPGLSVNRGDVWALFCAVTFGLHIIMISRMMGGIDALLFSLVQSIVVAICTGAAGLAVNGTLVVVPESPEVLHAVVYCAIFATAYMYTAMATLQRNVSEIKAVMIYSLEPLFAAIVAFICIGERMSAQQITGGLLIFAGMILADLKIRNGKILKRPGQT